MEKSEESQKKQWSLFQAFCCGPKATKKRSSPPSQQPECNVLSPRQIVASEIIQRNSHNQTNIAMRPTAINEDNQHNNYQHGQDIEEDNQSHLSSHKLPAQHKQQPTSQLSSLPSNHIVNIKTNQMQHHRQASQQYEPPSLQMLKSLQQQQQQQQQQQYQQQQQQQLQELQQQSQQVSRLQSQSFHRRAFSNVNPSSSNLRQADDVIHEVEQSQAYSQQSQRLEESHQSMNSARRQPPQQSQHQQFYTMENQFFKLKTRYAIHEIDFVENRPQDKEFQSYFLFDCPICFRHFNKILKSDCCDHYLCHYCLRDIYNKAKDSQKDSFKFRCMFCQLPAPLYLDADCAADKIKRYSDSPFVNTPKEQTAGGTADAVQPFNIHLNNLIEFAEDNNNSIDKENNSSISHHNEQKQHFVNNCSVSHAINKPPLPHLSLNQKIQPPQLPAIAVSKKDKNSSFQENENVHQSAHKPAGLIPEFQNKYHCNYLQNNGNAGNNNNQQSSLLRQQQQQQLPISQSSSLSITQSTSIKLFR